MIKQINRSIVYPIIYRLGIAGFLIKRSGKNLILCYHGVSQSPDFRINNRHIKLKQFEKDIIFYKKNFEIVGLPEFFERKGNKNKKPLLAITFDDGYVNNFINVLPIAEKYSVPVTFFIISGGLDNTDFITWYDLLDFVKLSGPKEIEFDNDVFIRMTDGGYYKNNELIDIRIKSLGKLRQMALDSFYVRYKATIDNNKNEYPEYWKLADKGLLKSHVANPYLSVGSHTHLHYNLGNIDTELVDEELKISKQILQQICNYKIRSVAYPDGSYNEKVKEIAVQAGYDFQLAVDYKLESDLKDKNILRRYSVSNSTTHEANMLKMALGIRKFGI